MPWEDVRCRHGKPAEMCHQCTSCDTPPDGWAYDWSRCSSCHRTRELHDACEAKTTQEMRHRQTPVLRRTPQGTLTD